MLALLDVDSLVDLLFHVFAMIKCEAETGFCRAFGRWAVEIQCCNVRGSRAENVAGGVCIGRAETGCASLVMG